MADIKTFEMPSGVAKAAVLDAITPLNGAIRQYGHAVWMLAGGTSPVMAHRLIAANYADAVNRTGRSSY